jgi:peptide deformylase
MMKLKILTEKGKKRRPVLHLVCQAVSEDDEAEHGDVRRLAAELTAILQANPASIGIAAPQVGVALRVIAIRRGREQISVLVNPVIERTMGWRMVEEGCLSLPGRTFLVQRSQLVRVRAQDPETGSVLRISAQDNVLAQALEHEIDHLDGVLLTDKGQERLDGVKIIDPWARK